MSKNWFVLLTVDRDSEQVTELFELAPSQFQRTKVPQHQVIVGSVRLQLVAMCNQSLGKGTGVSNHLLGVGLPGGLTSLQQSGSNTGNSLWRKFYQIADSWSGKTRTLL